MVDGFFADRPKLPNPSSVQIVQNRPVNSEFIGLSFTAIKSFYINQLAQPADLSFMKVTETCAIATDNMSSINGSPFVNYSMILSSVMLALFTKAIRIWKQTIKIR